MNPKRLLMATCMAALMTAGADASPNLIVNPDFSQPSSAGNTVVVTATSPDPLGGPAAAYHWSVWTGQRGGRVITSRTPTGDASGGYMLDVLVQSGGDGLVQAFLQPDTGPSRVYACVSVRLIRGSVGIGVGNGGNTGNTTVLDQPGAWQQLGTWNGVSPANELIVYRASDSDAEFQVRSAYVGVDPVPCGGNSKFVRPETLYKPPTPPWQMHPAERGGDIQSASPSANGHFNNMSPGGVSHDDSGGSGHEPTHPVGGGGKKPSSTTPANQIQQEQQPAAPQ